MNRYTLAVLVRNQFGVLNRLTSMFRRRQFNISSITASETESAEFSRITFSFDGEEEGKQQLINQLYKLATVESVEYGGECVTVTAMADAKARGMMRKYLAEPEIVPEDTEFAD